MYMTEECLLHHGPLHAAEPYNLVASQSEQWILRIRGLMVSVSLRVRPGCSPVESLV